MDRGFGTEEFGNCGLDADVITVVVRHAPDCRSQGFHGEKACGHPTHPHPLDLSLGVRSWDRDPPVGSIESRLPCLFRHAEADCRNAHCATDIEDPQGGFWATAHFTEYTV